MIDKSKFKDNQGRFLTESMFLEIKYNEEFAIYTDGDDDKKYKGKVYPSLKKLFLESSDPTEYVFATTHLGGWKHWKKLNENKRLKAMFDDWRDELEVKMRSEGLGVVMFQMNQNDNLQAAKFMVEGGWKEKVDKRTLTKEEVKVVEKKEESIVEQVVNSVVDEDYERLLKH